MCFVVKQRGERDSQNQAVLAKLKCAAGKETVHRPDFHRYSYQKAPVSDVDQSYGYRSVCCKAPQDSIFTVNATITSKHVGYTFLQLGKTYLVQEWCSPKPLLGLSPSTLNNAFCSDIIIMIIIIILLI